MAELTDLMGRYVDGEAAAFRELYAAVAPRLYGYLVKMSRNRPLADDLLQQTFLKIHRARAAYVKGADPLPWMYAIAHRTFLDAIRKDKRAIVKVGADDELPEMRAEVSGAAEGTVDAPADPELVRTTLDALAKLPEQQREAVVLTKLEGKSVAEAAEIAGTTPGAMKVRAHRGYEALRSLLGAVKARLSSKEAS
ncbi:MAG TPA: RNA polymerase sigma factor [Kofleriaceae bacterium]|jgi:RNA polymerase sigma-70 factor (ECF subfamily)